MLNLFSLTACGVMEISVISFSSRLFNTLRLSISGHGPVNHLTEANMYCHVKCPSADHYWLKIFSLLFSQNAMQIVGFMEDEVQSVLELVAAVLKLGNIEFKPESRVNGFDESRVKDKNGEF